MLGRVREDLVTDPPVYLIAPAGHPNYGDELLLRTWLRVLERLRPRSRVIVDCHTPGQAALLHRGANADVVFTDTVWRLVAEVAGAAEPGREAVELVRRALADPGARPALAAGVAQIREAAIVHVIGGGFVNAHWPHHLGVLAAAAEAARLGGGRAVATGQGLAPVADPVLLAEVLDGFASVTVRDAASRDAVSRDAASRDAAAHGHHRGRAELVGDDAWLALSDWARPGDLYRTDPDVARDVMLCLQSDLGDAEALTRVADRTLRRWAVPGERITVIEGIPGADRVVWDRLVASPLGAELGLAAARFVSFHELWGTGLPARPGQAWLSTRFHPHLLAAAAGASGVAVAVDPDYYGTKHDSLRAAGSRWTLRGDDDEVGDLPTGGGFPGDAVARLVASAEAEAAAIYRPGRARA